MPPVFLIGCRQRPSMEKGNPGICDRKSLTAAWSGWLCHDRGCLMSSSIAAMSSAAIVTFDFSIRMFPPVII